jgi:argininosuccinate lyase
VIKGLPLAYQKDMQEDKEPAMDALQALSLCVAAMAGMVRDLTPQAANMKKAAAQGYSTATDLADWCVRTLNIPFRDSHHIAAKAVGLAESKGVMLHKLTLEEFKSVDARINESVYEVLSVEKSVKSRTSYGGTAPANVTKQAKSWIKKLSKS